MPENGYSMISGIYLISGLIVSTTGFKPSALADRFNLQFFRVCLGSLADFQSAKQPTGFQPVVIEFPTISTNITALNCHNKSASLPLRTLPIQVWFYRY